MAAAPSGRNPLESIRRLYYDTSKATVGDDLARAIDLFKQLASEDERERAAVYMDGLSQMRSEWSAGPAETNTAGPGPRGSARKRPPRPR